MKYVTWDLIEGILLALIPIGVGVEIIMAFYSQDANIMSGSYPVLILGIMIVVVGVAMVGFAIKEEIDERKEL